MDLVRRIDEVKELPHGVHWFCPRNHDNDDGVYFLEDIKIAQTVDLKHESEAARTEREKRIEEAGTRREMVLDAFRIFAFDGKDATPYREWLKQKLEQQLSVCTICNREFNRARVELIQSLERSYAEDEVAAFMKHFDEISRARITAGLERAEKLLKSRPPEEQSIRVLDPISISAIFETLNCDFLLTDEAFLTQHFDAPFTLVQTNRPLRTLYYTPALTYFTFETQRERLRWAQISWAKFKRNITAEEFEWSIRKPLKRAMLRVQLPETDTSFLPSFWQGVRKIVSKLDGPLVTHSLRAMEIDICRLALDHLQFDSDSLKDLLASIHDILKMSPNDFWDSLGSIPASVWIDQFLQSPALKRLIPSGSATAPPTSDLDLIFGWMTPFVQSIKPMNQAASCGRLVDQLFGQFQKDTTHSETKDYCFKLGLELIRSMLNDLYADRNSIVVRLGVTQALEVVTTHIDRIVVHTRSTSSHASMASSVLRLALSLDCKNLVVDQELLANRRPLPTGALTITPQIWNGMNRALRHGSSPLVVQMFKAVKELVGSERFVSKQKQPLAASMETFNKIFDEANEKTLQLLETINDLDPGDVQKIFDESESAHAFVALLFSADGKVRSAVVDIMKSVSGHGVRKDAFADALESYCTVILKGLSGCLRRLANKKTFAPLPTGLKILRDVIECLCDSRKGILRLKTLDSAATCAAEDFWKSTWKELATVFSCTEEWSNMGREKEMMMDFCKDVMGFAEFFFDQFSVFKSALQPSEESAVAAAAASDKPQANTDLGKRLVDCPRDAMEFMVKFLRLRDDFLLAKSTALVCSLLKRLRQFDNEVDKSTRTYIEAIITKEITTVLSGSQLAELRRALEINVGRDIASTGKDRSLPKPSALQQTRISQQVGIDFEKWQSSAKSAKPLQSSDEFLSRIAPASESMRSKLGIKDTSQTKSTTSTPKDKLPQATDVSEFMRKRKEEKAAIQQRKLEAIAAQKRKLQPNGIASMTADQGSGISKLGIHGVDHSAPKGTGIMVSSSESDESDDSENELDKELFGGKPKEGQSSKTTLQGAAKRPPVQGPVKKQRLVRSVKDMRARLAPDLAPLHKDLLAWDYFHQGEFPPGSRPGDYAAVLNTFRDAGDYQQTFQPLLTLEAWNSFLKDREENQSRPYEIKVNTRTTVDAFLELNAIVSQTDAKEVSEGDIVLLSKSQRPAQAKDEPHCLARVHRVMRKKAICEVVYRVVPGTSLTPYLKPNVTLYGLKVTSIIPLEREYGALLGLQYYDLCDEIAKARPSPLLNYSEAKLEPLIRIYQVNQAQAKAIQCARDNDAFTLIQGPPGSGKTKTIVATVGALLTETLRNAHAKPVNSQARPQQGGPGQTAPASKKLLVCAPSNAAVDELVMRFKDGVKTTAGESKSVNIVRLGRSDAISASVADVTLEELVNKRLNRVNPDAMRQDTKKLMDEHKTIDAKFKECRAKIEAAETSGQPTKDLRKDLDDYRRSRALLSQKIDAAKDNEATQVRQAEQQKRRVQQEIIEEAHVICATLSGSGHEMFQNLNVEFETVIIDEAAQCVELSALIPLKYGCAKCVLVGDPQQLPPTVFSREAARFKYEQSLFVRMQANHPKDVHLLDTQYRMHPDISAFPSRAFYDNRLLDGKGMAAARQRPWHAAELLGPYRFFDVQGQHEAAPRGHSLINQAEIRVAMLLYNRLREDFPNVKLKRQIGIITPYKSQLRELRAQFVRRYGENVNKSIEFNTTDAFQGRESEIIIFSCVRASPTGGIGFLDDIRRMNVGLTRAKSSLWVLGNSQSLAKGEFWKKLLDHSRDAGAYTSGNLESTLQRPLARKIKEVTMGGVDEVKGKAFSDEDSSDSTSSSSSGNGADADVKTKTPSGNTNGNADVKTTTTSGSNNGKVTSSSRPAPGEMASRPRATNISTSTASSAVKPALPQKRKLSTSTFNSAANVKKEKTVQANSGSDSSESSTTSSDSSPSESESKGVLATTIKSTGEQLSRTSAEASKSRSQTPTPGVNGKSRPINPEQDVRSTAAAAKLAAFKNKKAGNVFMPQARKSRPS